MAGTAESTLKYRRVQVITKQGIVAASDDNDSRIHLIDKNSYEILHKFNTLLRDKICGAGDNMMNSMCELNNFVYVVSRQRTLVRLQLEKPYEEVEVKTEVEDICALDKDVFIISKSGLLSCLFSQKTLHLESKLISGTEQFGIIKGYKDLLFITSFISDVRIKLYMVNKKKFKEIDSFETLSECKP